MGIWQNNDKNMTEVLYYYDHNMTSILQNYDSHMTIIWQENDKNMTEYDRSITCIGQ